MQRDRERQRETEMSRRLVYVCICTGKRPSPASQRLGKGRRPHHALRSRVPPADGKKNRNRKEERGQHTTWAIQPPVLVHVHVHVPYTLHAAAAAERTTSTAPSRSLGGAPLPPREEGGRGGQSTPDPTEIVYLSLCLEGTQQDQPIRCPSMQWTDTEGGPPHMHMHTHRPPPHNVYETDWSPFGAS